MENFLIAIIVLYVIPAWLYIDLMYWAYSQNYLHWKKKKAYGKLVPEETIKREYRCEIPRIWITIATLLPLFNLFAYLIQIAYMAKSEYEYSSKCMLEDLASWKKGLNSLIFRKWTREKN